MKLNDPTLLRTESYINGAWVTAPGDKRFAVTNPATHDVIAEVADLGSAETTAAIDAAMPAQKAWAARTATDRALVMRNWYELIMAKAEDLSVILTTEMGKPITEARGEMPMARASSTGSPKRRAGSAAMSWKARSRTSAS